jgi:hypothetical protein
MSARNLKSSKWHNEYIESSRVLQKERLVNEKTRLRGLRTEHRVPTPHPFLLARKAGRNHMITPL